MEQSRTIFTVITTLVVVVLVVISVMAYQSIKGNAGPTTDATAGTYTPNQAVKMTAKLPVLDHSQYALWGAVETGETWLVSTFLVNAQKQVTDLAGKTQNDILRADGHDLTAVTSFFVTVEPLSPAIPATPSATVILKTDGSAQNSFKLQWPRVDTVSARGTFILMTPTDGPNSNEPSGLWFTREVDGQQRPSLALSLPPDGWVYESWVIYHGHYISLGRFANPIGRDNSSNFSGPRPGPAFPGEDLLTNAPDNLGASLPLDLTDGQAEVLISLEPAATGIDSQRLGEGISPLVILRAKIMTGAEPGVPFTLANVFAAPSATIQILTQ